MIGEENEDAIESTNLIEEAVDLILDDIHHIIKIVIDEVTGQGGAICNGCCANEVTHPFNGESFDFNKVVPKIIRK